MGTKQTDKTDGLFPEQADSLDARKAEFWANLWDHTADEFQASYDKREPLTKDEIERLKKIVEVIHDKAGDDALNKAIVEFVTPDPEARLATLLQLVGGTRAKLVTDMKAMAGAKKIKVSTSTPAAIFRDANARALAIPYMAQRLVRVLGPLASMSVDGALESLNQATYPGYIRQQRAKEQGGESEARLARVLEACGIPFVPEDKAKSPLCPDAQILGVSFDIVVPNLDKPRLVVKSTVHTSNIGQYGESKDALEMDEARVMLDSKFRPEERPLLLALADGVGFKSNSAGLSGVLTKAHEFCQFKTVWKGVMLGAKVTGKKIRVFLPKAAIEQHSAFFKRYGFVAIVSEMPEKNPEGGIPVGEAIVVLP